MKGFLNIGFAVGTFAVAVNPGTPCVPSLVRESTPPSQSNGAITLRPTCGRKLDMDGPYGIFVASNTIGDGARSLVGTYVDGAKRDGHAITLGRDSVAEAKTILAVATDEDGTTLLQSFNLDFDTSQTMAMEESESTNFNATCNACRSPEILCQDECQNPPQTCTFYSSCAEASLPCGNSGYAIGYGLKNCNKFMQRLAHFSATGQAWVFRVMTCLQRFLINGPLQRCSLDCSSLKADAFGSHPKCYVDSGVCDLPIGDWVQLVITIRDDLLTLDTLKQAVTTGGDCLSHYLQEISEEIHTLETQLEDTNNKSQILGEIAVLTSIRHVLEE